MTQEHPITPPPELIAKWAASMCGHYEAARWGWNQCMKLDHAWLEAKMQEARDEELEECLQWFSAFYCMETWMQKDLEKFRAARRPKPPSLKDKALLQLDTLNADLAMHGMGCDLSQIRRAIEFLPS
jgi:hypothetical protein